MMNAELIGILALFSNIGVSIGTILLALFTWKIIKNNNSQMKISRRQSEIMISQNNPYLQVKDVEFIKNKIWFKLKNTGRGDAYKIGVYSQFYKTRMNVLEYRASKDKQLQGKVSFDYDILPLIDYESGEKKKVLRNGNVDFLRREGYQNVILKSGEEVEFSVEPRFFLGYHPDNKFRPGTYGRGLSLKDLISLLKKNNVKFFYLTFEVLCKNAVHDLMEALPLASFVYDIEGHKSLSLKPIEALIGRTLQLCRQGKLRLNLDG